ncbi:helix-turn-helix domain-containing protein [Natrinema marinum]|uniref:helix-turn-helix domain-containing protein n=1 Tax=Natrinema marinum TaxID=2961598 RepID=UPI0020C89691|nr:helix-turn-helix domain-containing protein [Natrinema marinum]
MAVIVHLRIPPTSFELGRILELEESGTVELENMVPLGEKAVPFLSVNDEVREAFEQNVSNHPSVEHIVEVTSHDGERLYSLDWDVSRDVFLQGVIDLGGQLLGATGTLNAWEFEIRFPTHGALSDFQEYCSNAHIPLEVGRIYNPVRPGTGMWYGVTEAQRETLMRAVQGGYYSIPRRMSTQDLATDLDISDQAVTERLRRAIVTLTENTLIAMEEELDEKFE